MTTWSKCYWKFLIRTAVMVCFMVWAHAHLTPVEPVERPMAVGSPEELSSRMDCWKSGDHGMPTNVIFRMDGDWKIGGSKAVDKAFGQIFDGEDNGITIYAFCKA